jgi:non-homologous end joining protein Ku
MRPYWKGYLKLALVSCPTSPNSPAPVRLVPFTQVDRATPCASRHGA